MTNVLHIARLLPGYLIEQNRTKIQSNSIEHQSFDWVRWIEQNRTSVFLWVRLSNQSNQSNKIKAIELNPIRFCSASISWRLKLSKSHRSNHDQPLLNGINRKTSQKISNWLSMFGYTYFCRREQNWPNKQEFGNRTFDWVRLSTVGQSNVGKNVMPALI